MTIIVSPFIYVDSVVAARRPSHLITLLDPDHVMTMKTPTGIGPGRHLRLGVSDISDPSEGLTHPEEGHVLQILDFARDWDETSPLLVHCWAGISRSTATAFVLACERNPETPEREIAWRMRRAAAHAYPNRRIVRLADALLGRGGRMIDAVEEIGGIGLLADSSPFDLPARF